MTNINQTQEPSPEPLIVFGGTTKGETCLRALSFATGATLWETIIPKVRCKASMAVGSGLVVCATADGDVYCLDHGSGESMWSQKVERRDNTNAFTPLLIIEEGSVVVGLQGYVNCFDSAGRPLWRELTGTAAMGVTGRVSEPRK